MQNEDTLSYHRVRGLYFQAVIFVATIVIGDGTNLLPSAFNHSIAENVIPLYMIRAHVVVSARDLKFLTVNSDYRIQMSLIHFNYILYGILLKMIFY